MRQHVRAQQHRRAHGAHRQRLADAGGVAAQQIELQRAERVRRNRGLGEVTEAGVDAVDRRRRRRRMRSTTARARVHARARLGRRARPRAVVRDREQLGERQGVPSSRIIDQSWPGRAVHAADRGLHANVEGRILHV